MAPVIARRTATDPKKPRVWLYWDGKAWNTSAATAERFPTRGAALARHKELVGPKGTWPEGHTPVVREIA